jgi:transposase-like protein
LKGDRTLAELADKYDVHGSQITRWKTQLLQGASEESHLECPFLGAPSAANRLVAANHFTGNVAMGCP